MVFFRTLLLVTGISFLLLLEFSFLAGLGTDFFGLVCDLESVAVLFVLGDVSFFLASKSFYHCCFIGKNDIQKHD